MLKKLTIFSLAVVVLINLCGCFALIAGAGGAGTAMWLSGKLTQEFPSTYDNTIRASEKALESLKLAITKRTHEETVTQLRSQYLDGRDIWIDIRRVAEKSTKVEVRVGAVSSNKEAASKILKRIQGYL